jgi:hypothetical protein
MVITGFSGMPKVKKLVLRTQGVMQMVYNLVGYVDYGHSWREKFRVSTY